MVLVVAAVVLRQGKVLICRRPLGKHHGGLWEFPGGKVEAGESNTTALSRELDEELGITSAVVDPVPIGKVTEGELCLHFHIVDLDGEPEAKEHSDIAWVETSDLLRLELAPIDRRFAESCFWEGALHE